MAFFPSQTNPSDDDLRLRDLGGGMYVAKGYNGDTYEFFAGRPITAQLLVAEQTEQATPSGSPRITSSLQNESF